MDVGVVMCLTVIFLQTSRMRVHIGVLVGVLRNSSSY